MSEYDELKERCHACSQGCNSPFECSYFDKPPLRCMRQLLSEAANAIEELSRRETPMRVRITTSTKRCPSCNKQVSGIGNIHSNYRFCRWCGQALDWTEPPKEG